MSGLRRAIAAPVLGLIWAYQATLGRMLPDRCRFAPSCSHYASATIRMNGLVVGGALAVWRLLRCGPWTAGGIDEPRRVNLLRRADADVRYQHHLDTGR